MKKKKKEENTHTHTLYKYIKIESRNERSSESIRIIEIKAKTQQFKCNRRSLLQEVRPFTHKNRTLMRKNI